MPARIKKIRHDDETRAKIRVANLITRMQRFALARPVITMVDGEVRVDYQDQEGNRVWPMTKEQIAATKILLDKALPSLTSVESKNETTRTFVLRAPEPAKDAEEWLREFGPGKTIEHKEDKA